MVYRPTTSQLFFHNPSLWRRALLPIVNPEKCDDGFPAIALLEAGEDGTLHCWYGANICDGRPTTKPVVVRPDELLNAGWIVD